MVRLDCFEHRFQDANLARIAQYPLSQPKHLSTRALGSMSRGFVDEKTNSLIAAFRWPGRIGFLGKMDLATGKVSHLTDLDGMMLYKVTSIAFDPSTRTAFYVNQNYAYRDINAINVDTGKKRRLLTDARIGDLAFNPADKSLWGIRHQNGFVTLVRIPPPYTSFNQVKTFRYGEILFDLDISPNGELASASYGTVDGKQSVKVWKVADLEQGNADDPVTTLSLPPSVPENFTFTPDSKSLLGNSYYTGVSNVFRLDVATGKFEVLTNAATGFFRPQLRPDGSLLVYDYTGEGFNPAIVQPKVREDLAAIHFLGTEVVNAHPELKSWGVGSPAKVPLDQMIIERGTYKPFARMRIDASYPIISGYNRSPAFGYYLHLADPLQFSQISATASVSPFNSVQSSERFHFDIDYQTPNWKLTYWHNLADVYDLAGPVLRSRKGDAFIASYTKPLIYDPPRQLDVFGSAATYFGLDALPGAQNIPSPAKLQSAEVGLKYTNTTKSLGRCRSRKGHRGSRSPLAATRRRANSIPGSTAVSVMAFRYRLPDTSFWIYASWGHGRRAERKPAGRFLPRRDSATTMSITGRKKRYRELESFPGFDIDEIAARRFAKLTGEVNLPPVRFAEVGTPAFT